MTRDEFNSLPVGTHVCFKPTYVSFAFPATVQEVDGTKGVWVNFFGEGQCLFTPTGSSPERFYKAVRK